MGCGPAGTSVAPPVCTREAGCFVLIIRCAIVKLQRLLNISNCALSRRALRAPSRVAAMRGGRESVNKMRHTGRYLQAVRPRARDGAVCKSDETGKSAAGRSRRVRGGARGRLRAAISERDGIRDGFDASARSNRSVQMWPGSAGRCSGHIGALLVDVGRVELSAPTRQRRRVLHHPPRSRVAPAAPPRRAPSSAAAKPTCQFRHFCARSRFARRRLGTLPPRAA